MSNGNMPVVTVSQFTEIIKLSFEEKNYRPIFGLGKGGIGKTESIADLARKELKIGYIDVRLLLFTETDLKGIPYPNAEHTKSIWLQNDILPNAARDGNKGILVFDEITSCHRSVRTAAYQLLNERRLGEYVLPDGWMIVCLGNGMEDGGDYQGLEGNFANRCSIFNVVPELDSFKQWGYQAGINYLVLGYVSWRPGDMHTYKPDNETDVLFASPRSWKAVSDILNAREFDPDNQLMQLRILSNIGPEVGNKFIAFCKYKESAVNPSDILAGKKVAKITNNEVLFMTMQGVVKLLGDNLKTDIANNKSITAPTVEQFANGVKWMLTLDRLEHKIMGIKDLIANDSRSIPQILLHNHFDKLCPEFKAFANSNRQVFKK